MQWSWVTFRFSRLKSVARCPRAESNRSATVSSPSQLPCSLFFLLLTSELSSRLFMRFWRPISTTNPTAKPTTAPREEQRQVPRQDVPCIEDRAVNLKCARPNQARQQTRCGSGNTWCKDSSSA